MLLFIERHDRFREKQESDHVDQEIEMRHLYGSESSGRGIEGVTITMNEDGKDLV